MSTYNNQQSTTGFGMIVSGVGLQLFGLVWGLNVANTPFPRLALTAHIQAMANGTLFTGIGLALRQTDILELNPTQSKVVSYGLNSAWIVVICESVNAYWGAKEILPIAAKAAGSIGASPLKEKIVSIIHYASSVGMIASLGILAYELLFGVKGCDLLGKGKKAAKEIKGQ